MLNDRTFNFLNSHVPGSTDETTGVRPYEFYPKQASHIREAVRLVDMRVTFFRARYMLCTLLDALSLRSEIIFSLITLGEHFYHLIESRMHYATIVISSLTTCNKSLIGSKITIWDACGSQPMELFPVKMPDFT